MISMSEKERPREKDVALTTGMVKNRGGVGLCEVTCRHNCSVLKQYVSNITFEIYMRNIKHSN